MARPGGCYRSCVTVRRAGVLVYKQEAEPWPPRSPGCTPDQGDRTTLSGSDAVHGDYFNLPRYHRWAAKTLAFIALLSKVRLQWPQGDWIRSCRSTWSLGDLCAHEGLRHPGSETALQFGRSRPALMFNHLDSIKHPFSLRVALLGAIQKEDVMLRMEICIPSS